MVFSKVFFTLTESRIFSIVVLSLFTLSIIFFILHKIISNSKVSKFFEIGEFFSFVICALYIIIKFVLTTINLNK